MADYTVIATNLNMRDQPVNGAIIAVLHHGQIVSGGPSPADPAWLDVTAAPPSAEGDVKGFVSAAYVEESAPAKPGAATPVTSALLKLLAPSGKAAIFDAVAAGLSAVKQEFGIIQSTMTMCHFIARLRMSQTASALPMNIGGRPRRSSATSAEARISAIRNRETASASWGAGSFN